MGKNETSRPFAGSDSGYGDDWSDRASLNSAHPLARKGYEIGPASKLQIGDVFEFLWADCPEFEREWKCLGYTRFIVLRHSDSFPHCCACVPISVGDQRDFAKPGIDALQQGYIYTSGEKDRDRDRDGAESIASTHQPKNLPQLPFSAVGVNLHSGRHRIKDDSRANYGDIVEVDHEAQVMVLGDVVRYFDRVRKNVNKAFMRQVLREALGSYCERKRIESAAAEGRGWGNNSVLELVNGAEEDGEGVQGYISPEEPRAEDAQMEGDVALRKDVEDVPGHVPADTSRDEHDKEGGGLERSPAAPVYITRSHEEEQRATRAASWENIPPEAVVGVRPGMDKAGLNSLRRLRQGLPETPESDEPDVGDAQSLLSLAMAGRSDSSTSRKPRSGK